MSEQTAFLTRDTLEDRKEIMKKVKDLYKLRSQIAHYGTATIKDVDFFEYLNIIKQMINNIFKLMKEFNLKTSDDLRNYIIDLEFSV